MARFAVGLYTQLWVEVEVEADNADDAVMFARTDATTLTLDNLTDPCEIVRDWGAETDDWEFQSVGELED